MSNFTNGTYNVDHYSSSGFKSLHKQFNLTPQEAVVVAHQRRMYLLSQGVSLAQIMRGQIDNPFTSETAFHTMKSDALRMKASYGRRACQ